MDRPLPELLAPVATWEMCLAAVHNGADAIYVGMPFFNARGRTEDLSIETLREMIEFCHLYGVRVFLAFNVLIFEQELPEALELLRQTLPLAPDALIIQDIGLARLIKQLAPEQVIHASTQMTVTCAEAIECTADLGFARYVLGREVSIPEIDRIRAATEKELEVFVHGALCVSYSGQCLTSESIGGRSANRGQCAQSCRWPYSLVVDGRTQDLGARRHLVSPKDLCGLDEVGRLREIGVDSFKIEGRLKTPAYVAQTVQSYSAAIRNEPINDDIEDRLRIVYSRDFFSGWLNGVNHQQLVRADYSNHQGLEIGEIVSVQPHRIVARLTRPVEAGDGVAFLDFDKTRQAGANIFGVRPLENDLYELSFSREFATDGLAKGYKVFLNSAPRLERALRLSYTDRAQLRRIPVSMAVSGAAGSPLALTVSDDDGHTVTVRSQGVLETALKNPLNREALQNELGALSGSPFFLRDLCCAQIADDLFIHRREIKQLRQEATADFAAKRRSRQGPDLAPLTTVQDWIEQDRVVATPTAMKTPAAGELSLSVLVRERAHIDALAGLPCSTVYLDFEFGKEYGPALERVRELGFRGGIATTRILKPGELGHLKVIQRLQPDSILIRNLGALHYFKDFPAERVGDFSLNAANSLTAAWLIRQGLSAITPSYDLNQPQLLDLLEHFPGDRCEVTIHHYIPAFHMEHCVYAAFLSNGTSYRDCGKPCEKHRVALRDPNGLLHPLKADAECRNTMFNGTPQSAARLLPDLRSRGVSRFRFEALFEKPAELRAKISAYLDLLKDRISAESLFNRFQTMDRYGVSEGQLLNIGRYRDRKKGGESRLSHMS